MKIGRFMRKFRKQFRYGEKGFTLIELLVVVAILGILAAIIVPNFSKFIGTGSAEAACMEEKMVQTAVIAFQADNNGTLPVFTSGGKPPTGMDAFFVGGVAAVKGTYSLAGDVVTIQSYPGVTGVPACP